MRRWLLAILLATLVATAASLWLDARPTVVAAAVQPPPAMGLGTSLFNAVPPPAIPNGVQVPAQRQGVVGGLPVRLESLAGTASQRDPFAPVLPEAPRQAALAPPALAPALPPPPAPVPAPSAPPVKVRFLGRMVTPEGDTLVFLAIDDQTVLARAGDQLDDGYVVQAVTGDAVVLVYPGLDAKVTLPMPPAPDS